MNTTEAPDLLSEHYIFSTQYLISVPTVWYSSIERYAQYVERRCGAVVYTARIYFYPKNTKYVEHNQRLIAFHYALYCMRGLISA